MDLSKYCIDESRASKEIKKIFSNYEEGKLPLHEVARRIAKVEKVPILVLVDNETIRMINGIMDMGIPDESTAIRESIYYVASIVNPLAGEVEVGDRRYILSAEIPGNAYALLLDLSLIRKEPVHRTLKWILMEFYKREVSTFKYEFVECPILGRKIFAESCLTCDYVLRCPKAKEIAPVEIKLPKG